MGSTTLYVRIPNDLKNAISQIAYAAGLTLRETAEILLRRGMDDGKSTAVLSPAERVQVAIGATS